MKIRERLNLEIGALFDDITVKLAHIRKLVEDDNCKETIIAELEELEDMLT